MYKNVSFLIIISFQFYIDTQTNIVVVDVFLAGASPYGLTPSSQGSGNIMSPPPGGSSQDGWSMNGDYGSGVSDMHLSDNATTQLSNCTNKSLLDLTYELHKDDHFTEFILLLSAWFCYLFLLSFICVACFFPLTKFPERFCLFFSF